MPLDLYRQEALDAQRQRHYGTGLKVRVPSLAFLTTAAALVAAAVVSFLILGQYTRKEHVSGYLAPTLGLIKVYTPQQGTVVEKRVAEGQSVKQGQVLLVVSSERATASNQEAQAAMLQELRDRRDSLRAEQQKQAGIDTLAADELSKRIAALSAELNQARAQYSLQQQRVASALRTVRRHEELVAAKFVTEATVQEKQEAVLEQRSQLVALQRTITGLMRDQGAARVELESSALQESQQRRRDRPSDLRDRAAAHRGGQPPRGGHHRARRRHRDHDPGRGRTGRGPGLAAVVDPPRRGGAGSLSARAHARCRLHPAGPDRGAALPGLPLSALRPLPGRGARSGPHDHPAERGQHPGRCSRARVPRDGAAAAPACGRLRTESRAALGHAARRRRVDRPPPADRMDLRSPAVGGRPDGVWRCSTSLLPGARR